MPASYGDTSASYGDTSTSAHQHGEARSNGHSQAHEHTTTNGDSKASEYTKANEHHPAPTAYRRANPSATTHQPTTAA